MDEMNLNFHAPALLFFFLSFFHHNFSLFQLPPSHIIYETAMLNTTVHVASHPISCQSSKCKLHNKVIPAQGRYYFVTDLGKDMEKLVCEGCYPIYQTRARISRSAQSLFLSFITLSSLLRPAAMRTASRSQPPPPPQPSSSYSGPQPPSLYLRPQPSSLAPAFVFQPQPPPEHGYRPDPQDIAGMSIKGHRSGEPCYLNAWRIILIPKYRCFQSRRRSSRCIASSISEKWPSR